MIPQQTQELAALRTLQETARQALETYYQAPQRYGTAFHVSPPHVDVRQLPLQDFSASGEVAAAGTELAAMDVAALTAHGGADAYLLWQLAHIDVLPPHVLHVGPHEKRSMWLPSPRAAYRSQLVWIVLEAGAELVLCDLLQQTDISLRRMVVLQREGSSFHFWGARSGNVFADEKVAVYLQGRGAQIHMAHLVAAHSNHQSDMEVSVYHQAPDTVSDIKVRAAAGEQAHVLYRGLIDVARAAGGTQGYQQGKALMLSPKAVVDMLPKLEIATNNVRCSHGVSTTHLDDAALFYMRSRGVPLPAARQLAIRGFFHNDLEVPTEVATALEGMIDAAYAAGNG